MLSKPAFSANYFSEFGFEAFSHLNISSYHVGFCVDHAEPLARYDTRLWNWFRPAGSSVLQNLGTPTG